MTATLRLAATLLFGFGLAASVAAFAEERPAIGPGKGSFLYDDPKAATGKTLRVFYYRPKEFGPETPILFVMHGVKRNADEYRDNWIDLAERHGLLIVAPEFSNENFPKSWAYNLGNVVRRGHGGALEPIPESEWSFPIIDRIFDRVRRTTGSAQTAFSIFGHSAGAQFVHRYMTFTGGPKVDLAIAANAGWYTLPTEAESFPYGLGQAGLPPSKAKEAFAKKVVILLGEADTEQDRNFRTAPEAMRQGATRLDRGKYYFATAKRMSETLHAPFNWRLVFVPGVGHDNAKMAGTAAEIVVGGR
jgi:poly(3-hydroxybutyrate) depolymerase